MPYDVDYRVKPSDEDLRVYYELTKVQNKNGFHFRKSVHPSQYSKSCRHFFSLFPNNLLDICELAEVDRLNEIAMRFEELIKNSENGERQILDFIKNEKAFFIVGSIMKKYYPFGHHDAYLFSEFPLGTLYQADFLLAGKGSGGFQFIFIEFETPKSTAFRQDGILGEGTNKGLRQVEDWDAFIDANYITLKQEFDKAKSYQEPLPDEFISLDKSRIHYVVVSGRRDQYTELTYRTRRKMLSERDINLLHYDNIIESSHYVIGKNTY